MAAKLRNLHKNLLKLQQKCQNSITTMEIYKRLRLLTNISDLMRSTPFLIHATHSNQQRMVPVLTWNNKNQLYSKFNFFMPFFWDFLTPYRNIVATVNLNCALNLKTIAGKARNAEYNPRRFSAVIMRLKEPKTTALVFSSGKFL